MCGRFALHTPRSRIAARYFDLQLPVGDTHAKYKITPGMQITSVLATPDDLVSFDFSHWGFRAPWAKEDAPTPINIRAEKAATSPYFRSAFAHRRCLIPANGWYEWRKDRIRQAAVLHHPEGSRPGRGRVLRGSLGTGRGGDGDLLRDPDRTGLSGLCVHPRSPAGGARSRVPVAVAGSGAVGPGNHPQGRTAAGSDAPDCVSGFDPGQPAFER